MKIYLALNVFDFYKHLNVYMFLQILYVCNTECIGIVHHEITEMLNSPNCKMGHNAITNLRCPSVLTVIHF